MTKFFTLSSASEAHSRSPSSSVQPEQAPAGETPASFSSSLSTVENDQNVENTDTASKQVLLESLTDAQVDDISSWPEHMTKELIDYWAVKGAEDLHHSDIKSLNAKSAIQKGANSGIRKCTPALFTRQNRNGEDVIRSWLCFSPANGRVYCFFCKLMGEDPNSHMMDSVTGNTLMIDLVPMSNQKTTFKQFCQQQVVQQKLDV